MSRAEIVVDLDAIRHNVAAIAAATQTPVMTVVKADGYGHGMVEVAHAAKQAGAEWLGVATPVEAVRLRQAGLAGPILCWLTNEYDDFADAVSHDIDTSAYSIAELDAIGAAGAALGLQPRVQLKVDTGLGRGGIARGDWERTFAHAAAGEREQRWQITGVWSHLSSSDVPEDPANDAQEAQFIEAVGLARAAGLDPQVVHLANSAAALLRPSSRFDLVRIGIATYGLDPAPGYDAGIELRPAMEVNADLLLVKQIQPGESVSYNHTWTAATPTWVGLVPLGYGEGISRRAGNSGHVGLAGAQAPILGRICMDQFVVQVPDGTRTGDRVLVFGDGSHGEPTVAEWAAATGTINYEIVTQIGGRLTRRHVGSQVGDNQCRTNK